MAVTIGARGVRKLTGGLWAGHLGEWTARRRLKADWSSGDWPGEARTTKVKASEFHYLAPVDWQTAGACAPWGCHGALLRRMQ